MIERTLEKAESFVFSSDGLHGVVDSAVITRTLAADGTPERHAQALIDEALASGGADNITAVVLGYAP